MQDKNHFESRAQENARRRALDLRPHDRPPHPVDDLRRLETTIKLIGAALGMIFVAVIITLIATA